MRVFLCPYEGFLLAIPIEAVASLTLYGEDAGGTEPVEFNRENGNRYFFLPRLLQCPGEIVHGIVLKDRLGGEEEYLDTPENKNILLTTGGEREEDIAEERIYPLPRVLAGGGGAALFRGIQFLSDPGRGDLPLLVLDCEALINTFGPEVCRD
jgi:hypothetical protein